MYEHTRFPSFKINLQLLSFLTEVFQARIPNTVDSIEGDSGITAGKKFLLSTVLSLTDSLWWVFWFVVFFSPPPPKLYQSCSKLKQNLL